MKKSKNTKRALLASVLSTMLCMAMLIGSTFAWFTDTASTKVNKIQSGTLDVALEMKNAEGEWVNAENKVLGWKAKDGRPQEEILWEPGCTYTLPEIRVVNNGNLALKFKLTISGIVGDAKLLEAIDFTFGELDVNAEGHLAAGAFSKAITIEGHMKETAGNEYQNLSIEGIGITVVATQDTVESDSYDNQYDENAWNDVFTKANEDGTYSDGENTYVKVSNKYIEVVSTDVAGLYKDVDGNSYVANEEAIQSVVESKSKGEVISFTVLKDITLSNRITASGDLTINGEGNALIVERTSTSSDRVIDLSNTAEKVTITLNNVALVGPTTGSYNRGISLYKNKDVTVVLNNCSVSTNYYALNVAGLNENVNIVIKNTDLTGYAAINLWSKSNITLENCTITGINHWNVNFDNDFAVVVFTFDVTTSSAGSNLTFKNCKFVSDTYGNKEYFFRVAVDDITINLENCEFIYNNTDVTDTVKSDIANGKSQGGSNYLMWYEGRNTVFNVK